MPHWTTTDPKALRLAILAGFMCQIENELESSKASFGEFAERLEISQSHLAQVLAGDAVPPVDLMLKMAHLVGLTPSFVAYTHPSIETSGPLNPDVFVQLWEKAGRPLNSFAVNELEIKRPADQ